MRLVSEQWPQSGVQLSRLELRVAGMQSIRPVAAETMDMKCDKYRTVCWPYNKARR